MPVFNKMLDLMRKDLRLEIFADEYGVHIWAYDDKNNKAAEEEPWDLENPEFDRSGDTAGEAISEAFKRYQDWREENRDR
jgi:hypothetical protein